MKASEALTKDRNREGGKYHVPRLASPYETAFEAKVSKTCAYNASTPKMWPKETMYTNSPVRSELYDSDFTAKTPTHTFGHKAHAKTLKCSMKEEKEKQKHFTFPDISAAASGFENETLGASSSKISQLSKALSLGEMNPLPSSKPCGKSAAAASPIDSASLSPRTFMSLQTKDAKPTLYSAPTSSFSKSQPESKSNLSGTMELSAMHHALVECGKVKTVGHIDDYNESALINATLMRERDSAKQHASRLGHDSIGPLMHKYDSLRATAVAPSSSSKLHTEAKTAAANEAKGFSVKGADRRRDYNVLAAANLNSILMSRDTGDPKPRKSVTIATDAASASQTTSKDATAVDDVISCATKSTIFTNNKASELGNTVSGTLVRYKGKAEEMGAHTGRVTFDRSARVLCEDETFTKIQSTVSTAAASAAKEKKAAKRRGWYKDSDVSIYYDGDDDEYYDEYGGEPTEKKGRRPVLKPPTNYREAEMFITYGTGATPEKLAALSGTPIITQKGRDNRSTTPARVLSRGSARQPRNDRPRSPVLDAVIRSGGKALLSGKADNALTPLTKTAPEALSPYEKVKDYNESALDYMQMQTVSSGGVLKNPFRTDRQQEITHVSAKLTNPTLYRKDAKMQPGKSYFVSLPGAYGTMQSTGMPSKREVLESMRQVTKQAILAYDVRIVETGELVKALNDYRLPCPGLAAIVELNKALVNAAAMNPTSWILTRPQLMTVLTTRMHWYPKENAARLISAYDPMKTGIVRYIRMVSSAILCIRSGMNDLIAKLNRGEMTDEVMSCIPQGDTNEEAYFELARKYGGEIYLLRLIFNLYEDCDNGATGDVYYAMNSDKSGAKKADNEGNEKANRPRSGILDHVADHHRKRSASIEGGGNDIGIKMVDLMEMMTCASSGAEDEMAMQTEVAQLMQLIYDESATGKLSNSAASRLEAIELHGSTYFVDNVDIIEGEDQGTSSSRRNAEFFSGTYRTNGNEGGFSATAGFGAGRSVTGAGVGTGTTAYPRGMIRTSEALRTGVAGNAFPRATNGPGVFKGNEEGVDLTTGFGTQIGSSYRRRKKYIPPVVDEYALGKKVLEEFVESEVRRDPLLTLPEDDLRVVYETHANRYLPYRLGKTSEEEEEEERKKKMKKPLYPPIESYHTGHSDSDDDDSNDGDDDQNTLASFEEDDVGGKGAQRAVSSKRRKRRRRRNGDGNGNGYDDASADSNEDSIVDDGHDNHSNSVTKSSGKEHRDAASKKNGTADKRRVRLHHTHHVSIGKSGTDGLKAGLKPGTQSEAKQKPKKATTLGEIMFETFTISLNDDSPPRSPSNKKSKKNFKASFGAATADDEGALAYNEGVDSNANGRRETSANSAVLVPTTVPLTDTDVSVNHPKSKRARHLRVIVDNSAIDQRRTRSHNQPLNNLDANINKSSKDRKTHTPAVRGLRSRAPTTASSLSLSTSLMNLSAFKQSPEMTGDMSQYAGLFSSSTVSLPMPTPVPEAVTLTKYPILQTIKPVPRVTRDVFFRCLFVNQRVLEEFARQTRRFRSLVVPYSDLDAKTTYEEHIESPTRPPYGTRVNRDSEEFHKWRIKGD